MNVTERRKIYNSLIFPSIFLIIIWIVKLCEVIFNISFVKFGIYPLTWKGLPGILFSPLIHGDFSHLSANSLPVFILTALLFYFYRSIAYKVFFLIYFFTNIWLWVGAREAYHIGASGVIYGLTAFLFVSGIIRKNPRLMAITLIVAFLYGSMIWGIFPDFFPDKNISFEAHAWGLVAGSILAIYFRKQGPQRKKYEWEYEDDDNDDDDDDTGAYWNTADPKEI